MNQMCCGVEAVWVENVPGKGYFYCRECKDEVLGRKAIDPETRCWYPKVETREIQKKDDNWDDIWDEMDRAINEKFGCIPPEPTGFLQPMSVRVEAGTYLLAWMGNKIVVSKTDLNESIITFAWATVSSYGYFIGTNIDDVRFIREDSMQESEHFTKGGRNLDYGNS